MRRRERLVGVIQCDADAATLNANAMAGGLTARPVGISHLLAF